MLTLRKVERKLAAERGEFSLFALFQPEDAFLGRWDLIVAAPWARAHDYETMKWIFKRLQRELTTDQLLEVTYVEIVSATHASVREINRLVQTGTELVRLQRCEFFGKRIERACIFVSKAAPSRRQAPAPARKRLRAATAKA